jgi:NADH dehydrogenase
MQMDIPAHSAGPRVIIVGGGFGGVAAAQALRHAKARVLLISRSNHFLFQPLLYQVATSILAPAEIATPLRQILSRQQNATVALAEVSGVDLARRQVLVNYLNRRAVPLDFDFLVLATGVSHNYFGRPDFEKFAPGLKEATNATAIRDRILKAFEFAELEKDPQAHQDLLTFVLVGGGPTGVELAGAIAELRRFTLKSDFRRVKPSSARIVLVQSGSRILPTFHESLAQAAHRRLESLGVEIRLGGKVTDVDEHGVIVNGERIPSRTVIWTAGVSPSPAGKWLGAPTDKSGRVVIDSHCEVPGLPNVFVVGDTAFFDAGQGKPLPGVAQVAIQQGKYVGSLISGRLAGTDAPPPFRYFDKGNMAVVGRNFAIMEAGRFRLAGFFAWLSWALIHVLFLATPENRLRVISQWIWSYCTHQRGSRLILGEGGVVPLIDP